MGGHSVGSVMLFWKRGKKYLNKLHNLAQLASIPLQTVPVVSPPYSLMTPPVVHNQCPGVEYNQLVVVFDSVSMLAQLMGWFTLDSLDVRSQLAPSKSDSLSLCCLIQRNTSRQLWKSQRAQYSLLTRKVCSLIRSLVNWPLLNCQKHHSWQAFGFAAHGLFLFSSIQITPQGISKH